MASTLPVKTDALIVATNGGVFLGPQNKAWPTGVSIVNFAKAINDGSQCPEGFDVLGNTSKENLPEFSVDTDDADALGSWGVTIIRKPEGTSTVTVEIHPMQFDTKTIAKIANGWENEAKTAAVVPASQWSFNASVVIAVNDGGMASGVFAPNANLKMTGLPEFDQENFAETTITATLLAADAAAIPAGTDGRLGMMEIHQPVTIS